MAIISYENLEDTKSDPISYEGKSYPYNLVSDHRRFEELIYSIYKIKIARSEFSPYDSISLMNGVRDKGRDCALIKGGRNYGLIQCKQYEKSLSKDLFGIEITKFVLYSILEPTLIHNRNQFEYYIAISHGFTNDCSNFIDEFNNQIGTEPKLSKWIKQNLDSPTLAPLKINDPTSQVINILSTISVKKILPVDLDSLLHEPAVTHITPLFFQVRSVTDNSHIIELKDEFRRFTNKTLDKQEIEFELSKGSGSLKLQNNEIQEIPDSHIERSETTELFNWIINDLDKDKSGREKNICLLAGDAGIGKTVILKDLYDELAKQNIPVLALKADKLYPTNMQDLQVKINLSMPVFDFIEQCKQKFDTTVILIDQIDALSQSMSSDRNYLHVFRQLIDNFTYDSNIRIIISVRTFDLEYDPSLKIYKDIKKIKVDLLSEVEVHKQLDKIKFSKDALTPKLLFLLRTPNHLNIFATIYAKRTAPLASFSTIQELYSELWLQKIINVINPEINLEQLKLVLYRIASKMFTEQRISVSRSVFEDNNKELVYLESERILKVEGKQIQFFHQSFYDYIFAKDFVETGHSLTSYIKQQKQSIFIRSAVKMIVNYLRNYDHSRYIRDVENLLQSGKVFFHIKHLLVSMFAVIDDPTDQEKGLFKKHINNSLKLKTVFLEHAYGSGWTEIVFKSGVLNLLIDQPVAKKNTFIRKIYFKYLYTDKQQGYKSEEYFRNVCTQYLRNQLSTGSATIFDFVLKIRDQSLLRWLTRTQNNWDNPISIELFKKCENFREIDSSGYIHALENMLKDKPSFVFEQIKDLFFNEEFFDDELKHDYHSEKKLIKDLTEKIPFVVIDQLLYNLDRQINNTRYKNLGFNGDFKYKEIYLQEETDIYSSGLLYKLPAFCLRKAAAENNDIFKKFISNYKNNINHSYLRLLIFAYDVNFELYADEISDLLHHLFKSNLLHHERRINVEFRVLFEKAYPHLSVKNKQKVIELLKQLVIKDEIYVYQHTEKKRYYLTWGLTKYFLLKRLPVETLQKHKEIRREYQELERKFKNRVDHPKSQSSIAGVVRRPLSSQAFNRMSSDQWIRSFKKYDSDDRNWGQDHLKGGLHEHSWAFEEYLSKNSSKKDLDSFKIIISDYNINPVYKVRGIYGLTQANVDASFLLPFIEDLIAKKQYQLDQSLFLSSINYLIRKDYYNDNLVNFVVDEALNGETPKHWLEKEIHDKTSINGLVSAAINSSKGKAAESLVYINDKKYEEEVFKIIELLLQKESPQIRSVIYYRYAFLMNVNGERAFNLFKKCLLEEENNEVLASSIWSLQYLANHNFDLLRPIFEKLINVKNLGNDDRQGLLTIIFISYLKGKSNAKKLLIDFLTIDNETHFWAINEAFEYFYLFDDSPKKCLDILLFLLNATKPDEATKDLNIQFSKLENVKFLDIKAFLEAYIDSNAFQLTRDLTKYLTISCKDEPFDSVDLFSNAVNKKHDSTNNDFFYDNDHATQFIVAGFNAIKGNDNNSIKYRRKLLKSFDNVLSDYRFRGRAELILDAV